LLKKRYVGVMRTVAVGSDPQWLDALAEALALMSWDYPAFCRMLRRGRDASVSETLQDVGTAVLMHSPKVSRFMYPVLELEGSVPRQNWETVDFTKAHLEGYTARSAEEQYLAALEQEVAS
jgi:hypothetical protein